MRNLTTLCNCVYLRLPQLLFREFPGRHYLGWICTLQWHLHSADSTVHVHYVLATFSPSIIFLSVPLSLPLSVGFRLLHDIVRVVWTLPGYIVTRLLVLVECFPLYKNETKTTVDLGTLTSCSLRSLRLSVEAFRSTAPCVLYDF